VKKEGSPFKQNKEMTSIHTSGQLHNDMYVRWSRERKMLLYVVDRVQLGAAQNVFWAFNEFYIINRRDGWR
jgi:hypothetical protein